MTAKELKSIRLGAGYTRTELARLVGVSQPSVSRWEQGYTPISPERADAILAVCKAEAVATVVRRAGNDKVSIEVREAVPRLRALGLTLKEIATALGVSYTFVQCELRRIRKASV